MGSLSSGLLKLLQARWSPASNRTTSSWPPSSKARDQFRAGCSFFRTRPICSRHLAGKSPPGPPGRRHAVCSRVVREKSRCGSTNTAVRPIFITPKSGARVLPNGRIYPHRPLILGKESCRISWRAFRQMPLFEAVGGRGPGHTYRSRCGPKNIGVRAPRTFLRQTAPLRRHGCKIHRCNLLCIIGNGCPGKQPTRRVRCVTTSPPLQPPLSLLSAFEGNSGHQNDAGPHGRP